MTTEHIERRAKNLTLIYAKNVLLSHSETKNYSNFLKENKTASDASSRLFLHLKGSSLFSFSIDILQNSDHYTPRLCPNMNPNILLFRVP